MDRHLIEMEEMTAKKRAKLSSIDVCDVNATSPPIEWPSEVSDPMPNNPVVAQYVSQLSREKLENEFGMLWEAQTSSMEKLAKESDINQIENRILRAKALWSSKKLLSVDCSTHPLHKRTVVPVGLGTGKKLGWVKVRQANFHDKPSGEIYSLPSVCLKTEWRSCNCNIAEQEGNGPLELRAFGQ